MAATTPIKYEGGRHRVFTQNVDTIDPSFLTPKALGYKPFTGDIDITEPEVYDTYGAIGTAGTFAFGWQTVKLPYQLTPEQLAINRKITVKVRGTVNTMVICGPGGGQPGAGIDINGGGGGGTAIQMIAGTFQPYDDTEGPAQTFYYVGPGDWIIIA